MSHFTAFSTILLLILIFKFGENKESENNGFSKALCQVTLQLERGLRKDGENLFVSPLGLVTALGKVYLGAKGSSAQQIYQGLHFNEFANSATEATQNLKANLEQYKTRGKNYTLNAANQLFLQNGFEILEKYQKDVATSYSAPIQQLDFQKEPSQAAGAINNWVSDKTEGMIKELFKPGDIKPSLRLVLANAIYFHGFWENPFNADDTQVETFNKIDGSKEQTPLMRRSNTFLAYQEFPQIKAKVLQMNYVGKDIKMTVILPDETSGLYGVLENLDVEILQQMLGKLPQQKLNVKFPKFKFEAEYSDDLMQTLESNMGMTDIFNAGKADFSGITESEPLYVQMIKHKAIVDVDEKGTKAAAVTGILISATSLITSDEPRNFIADHPFMFIISDNRNGAIIFCGTYLTPPA